MKIWFPLLPLFAVLATLMATSGTQSPSAFSDKHVLLIGIDGLRSDALQQAMARGLAPNLNALAEGGTITWNAYAGGELGQPTQQPTISGPGWTSLFTGVWMDRHNVDGNATPPVNQPDVRGSYQLDRAPHFASRLKKAVPQARIASFSAWGWIENYLVAAQPEAFDAHDRGVGIKYPDRDLDIKHKTLTYLETTTPDVLVVHFDQVDGAGHATGFNTENPVYMAAIQKVDEHVGEILQALKRSQGANDQKWLVLVTTDHGGIGKRHGGQSSEERTIPIIAHGPGVAQNRVMDTPLGQTTIAPTLFRFLGVPVSPDWGWTNEVFALEAATAHSP